VTEPLLEAIKLSVVFDLDAGRLPAVTDVNLTVARGETVALVGESGCGKSVTALSLMGLVTPPGRIASGAVLFEGRNIMEMDRRQLRALRGGRIAMIFQEPMTSLNPVFTIGSQIVEAIRAHEALDQSAARDRAVELLDLVHLPEPQTRLDQYPHQLSGGMQQRAMIAMALACRPALLVADEPTTALDVTVQAEILALIEDLKRELGMAVIIITHDLGVVAETADRLYVMYAGRIVESAPVRRVFERPLHPYTAGLLRAVPRLGGGAAGRLEPIEGAVPNPLSLPSGCAFHPRCPLRDKICMHKPPAFRAMEPDHETACHFAESMP